MNPFSLPLSDQEVFTRREKQREVDRAITAEQRLIPVHLRPSKNTYVRMDELKNSFTPKSSTASASRRSQSFNRENIQEIILRKREILLTKKKIEHQRASISFLDNLSKVKEEEQKKLRKSLEDNLIMFEKYEENLKTEAKNRAEMADKKNKERVEKQMKIAGLEQEIDYMYGIYERRIEELKVLSKYKDFVEELILQDDSNKSTFITTAKPENHSALSLMKKINSFETKNLFLIQQAQEAEISLENLKSFSVASTKALTQEIDLLKSNIKIQEKNKEVLNLKLSKISNEEEEEALIKPETKEKIHERLLEIFETIGGDLGTFPTDFEILEILETSIRSEIEKTKLMDEAELKQIQKEVEKNRRFKNVEASSKLKELEKAMAVKQMIERSRKKVEKKGGRRGMERSRLPEKVAVEEVVEIPQEVLDWKEFLEEDIRFGK